MWHVTTVQKAMASLSREKMSCALRRTLPRNATALVLYLCHIKELASAGI